MPIAGPAPPTNVLVPRARASIVTYEQRQAEIPPTNAGAAQRSQDSTDDELATECLESTLRDVEAGWAPKPRPIADRTVRSAPPTPRFATRLPTGPQTSKIRPIDDF